MISSVMILEELLERLQRSACLVPEHVFSILLLKGKDAQDLLHRLSTNDLRRIPASGSMGTVLTNEKGRIIDRLEIRPGREGLLVVCHALARESVRLWIERFVITENVEVAPANDSLIIVWTLLSEADSSATSLAVKALMEAFAVEDFGTWETAIGPFPGRRTLIPVDRFQEFLRGAKAIGMGSLTTDEHRAIRVAAGVPSYPEELNDAHNPLESRLKADVSFTKGCYVGQEVIARLDSYDKVQRELVVLQVNGDLVGPERSQEILVDGLPAGAVTSTGGVLRNGATIVMGYIERSSKSHGKSLSVRVNGVPIAAHVFKGEELAGWPRGNRQ